jgi:DNA-binding NtrC family response regulator
MGERARILIVDDDESIRKTISTILKEKGYCVDTAENGEEAIEKTSTKFYNLALIDIKLSDMEGTDLLPLMRETTPRMIKIIVTGFPSLQNAIEAVNRNADAYIIKPVRIDELLAVIKEQLEMQEENRRYSEERVAEFIETRMRELEKERTVVARKSR